MALNNEEIQELRRNRLVELLKMYNMSQADLVTVSNGRIYASNLNNWIKGKAKITEATVEAIALLFPELNASWLLGYSDFKYKDTVNSISASTRIHNARFIMPMEMLDASIDVISKQLGIDRYDNLNNKEDIQELIDKLVSYSDFLIYDYIKKH